MINNFLCEIILIIYLLIANYIIIKYNNDNYSVSLKDIDEENIEFYINNYEIKPFEFWKKKDCQSFSPKEMLKSINEEKIIFFSKNPLNVFLMKKD